MSATNNPQAPSPRLPPRAFLYSTAAITGAAILVVEILGAKMLSPYVGSSHFVWTAQIAVTLISLAIGYYFGGWLVDRNPALHRLYLCIAGAAVYLALSVPVCESVTYYFLKNFKLALAAFFASLFLFFVPLTLLAATGPFLIRVLTQSVTGVGGQVGRLSAISTLGSVAGTVIVGYVVLPFLPNSTTMFITAGALLVLAGIYLLGFRTRVANKTVMLWIVGLLLTGAAWGLHNRARRPSDTVERLYHGNSNFGELQVVQQKSTGRRYYLNDFLIQNTYDPAQQASLSLFTYMLHELAWGYSTNLKSALCIGMGIGIVPRELAREGVQTDVVEINPAIVPVAQKYFDFDPAAVNVHIGDGRYFINKTQKHYDTIILDAFLGDSSPSHLMTREAFAEMSRLLGSSGVLVINSFGDFAPGRDYFLASLDKTLRAVFKHVNIHASGRGNVFYAASNRDLQLNLRPGPRFPSGADLQYEFNAATSLAPPPNSGAGIVLTDDFNPVDFYDAPNRERHRRALAFSMRNL